MTQQREGKQPNPISLIRKELFRPGENLGDSAATLPLMSECKSNFGGFDGSKADLEILPADGMFGLTASILDFNPRGAVPSFDADRRGSANAAAIVKNGNLNATDSLQSAEVEFKPIDGIGRFKASPTVARVGGEADSAVVDFVDDIKPRGERRRNFGKRFSGRAICQVADRRRSGGDRLRTGSPGFEFGQTGPSAAFVSEDGTNLTCFQFREADHVRSTAGRHFGGTFLIRYVRPICAGPMFEFDRLRRRDRFAVVEKVEFNGIDAASRAEVDRDPIALVRRAFGGPAIRRREVIPIIAVGRFADGRFRGGERRGDSGKISAFVIDRDVDRFHASIGFLPQRGQSRDKFSEGRRRGDFSTVREDPQTLAQRVALAGLVPNNGDVSTAIRHVVEREILPIVGRERFDLDRIVVSWFQADEAGDEKIVIARMKIMFAVIVRVVTFPRAGVGMRGFGDIWAVVFALGSRINGEKPEIIFFRNDILAVFAQEIGERLEGLRGRVRPRLTAPNAAVFRDQKQGVFPFGDGRAEVGEKGVAIHQGFPSGLKPFPFVRKAELPRDETDQLSTSIAAGEAAGLIGQAAALDDETVLLLIVAIHRKKERSFRFPQFLLKVFFNRFAFSAREQGGFFVSREVGDFGDGLRIGPKVTVQRGPIGGSASEPILGLAAVDVRFHAVVVAGLPKKPNLGIEPLAFPSREILFQGGQETDDESGSGMNLFKTPNRIGDPAAIASWLSAGSLKPIAGVISRIARIFEPAEFLQLMAARTRDRAEGSRPKGTIDKLGEGVTARGRAVNHVLRDQFPTVIVCRIDFRVGALEKRDVLFVPIPIAIVPKRLKVEPRLFIENRLRFAFLSERRTGESEEDQGRGENRSNDAHGLCLSATKQGRKLVGKARTTLCPTSDNGYYVRRAIGRKSQFLPTGPLVRRTSQTEGPTSLTRRRFFLNEIYLIINYLVRRAKV